MNRLGRFGGWVLAGLLVCLPFVQARSNYEVQTAVTAGSGSSIAVTQLPPEARDTLRLIRQGGPFPYPRDGVVFGNYERRLPPQPRGYYHEYTVPTPGVRHRGARRIVCGERHDCYYTPDHYRTFLHIEEDR